MSDRLRHLDLTAAGEPYRTAHSGNALNYDGFVDYTISTNFNQINADTAMTGLFTFTAGSTANNFPIIETVKLNAGLTQATGIWIWPRGFLFVQDASSGKYNLALSAATFNPGQKYTVIVTYPGTRVLADIRTYINGLPIATTTASTQTFGLCQAPGNTCYINAHTSTGGPVPTYVTSGPSKKIELVNRVLTAQEIRESFNAGTMVGTAANNEFLIAMDYDKVSGNPTNLVSITGSDTNPLAWTNVGGPTYSSFF